VLLNTANWLNQSVRGTDIVARYGGEEFAVIMAGARIGQVEDRLSKALKTLADDKFEYETEAGEKRTLRYTASIGVAELSAGDKMLDLIRRADVALYDAKHRGRNRVVAKKRSMLSNLFARGGNVKPA
jgi:diguanylate cyclase (GGDEF)-like protein